MSGQARLLAAASVLAEKFAGLLVDEMKPGAGEADDGRVGIGTGLVRRGLRKPMLHIRAQPRAFEKDVSAHSCEYAKLVRPVTSVCLRSWGGGRPGVRELEAANRAASLLKLRAVSSRSHSVGYRSCVAGQLEVVGRGRSL